MQSSTFLYVAIQPDRGLDNEESVRHANGKANRSTVQKHRTDEKN